MGELMVEQGLGTLESRRNEMIEILNDPNAMETLEDYFKHNIVTVKGQEFYGCNGWECDCSLARTFAMLKYIAHPEESRRLLSNSSESEFLSYQNAYYYGSLLPVDQIRFDQDDLEDGFRITINGDLCRESKIQRIEDLGLEDYISVTECD